jgi:prepilin-type N-terminal cleavage/methylation domain-containing protein
MINLNARRLRRGYTLGELLVTMTLLGIVGTIVTRLMLGQQRFYHRQAEQSSVRRELRTTMTLLPSDLRAISSSGGDLTDFSSSSVTFRNMLGASAICDKPDNTTMDLPPLDMARNVLTSWYTQPQVGDSVFAFNEGMLRGAEDDSWTGLRITSIAPSAALCPGSVLIDALLDAGKPRWRVTVTPAIPDSVKIGAGVRFERSTKYELTAAASNKYYLTRSEYLGGAWGAATPVSGPFEAPNGMGGGIQFRYFDSTGVAVNDVANSRRVARIDLLLKASGVSTSGNIGGGTAVRDSLALRVALRNRQ